MGLSIRKWLLNFPVPCSSGEKFDVCFLLLGKTDVIPSLLHHRFFLKVAIAVAPRAFTPLSSIFFRNKLRTSKHSFTIASATYGLLRCNCTHVEFSKLTAVTNFMFVSNSISFSREHIMHTSDTSYPSRDLEHTKLVHCVKFPLWHNNDT